MAAQALSGIKILEYANMIAGPYCAKLLADLGAEVVKVEEPCIGDHARKREPFLHDAPHPEHSGLFMYVNTNKVGITLNLSTETGKFIFQQLAKDADIMIESYPPGHLDSLGLGYQDLSAINPRLVMTSVTPFGQTGPYRDYKARHLNIYHGSGLGWSTWAGRGLEKEPPIQAGGFVMDYHSGLTAANGTLAALFVALKTGRGQYVDISEHEAALSTHRGSVSSYHNTRRVLPRGGDEVPGAAYTAELLCEDGWIWVQIPEEHQWRGLVELMGNPEWAKSEKFKDRAARSMHGEEWQELSTPWMLQHRKEDVYHQGQAKGVPVGILCSPEDMIKSPQLEARQYFIEIEHPEAGRVKHPGAPYKFGKTPAKIERPAPLLGQHNEEVLCSRLGYSKEDLVRMREAGII